MKATVLRVTTILAVVIAFTAVSVQAQSVIKTQTFKVPFSFNVGHKVMPAGDYTFTSENQIVRIQRKDGNGSVLALPQRTLLASKNNREAKLTFRRDGDEYYLSQVWLSDGLGRELKRQRPANTDIARSFTKVEIPASR